MCVQSPFSTSPYQQISNPTTITFTADHFSCTLSLFSARQELPHPSVEEVLLSRSPHSQNTIPTMLPLFRSHSAAAVMRPHLCMRSRLPTTAASLRSLAPASYGVVRRQRVMFHTSKRACDDVATAASTNDSESNESNDNNESVDALLVERASRFNNPYAMKTPAWYELQDLDSALPKDYTPPNARPLGKAGKLANSFVPEARHAQRGSKGAARMLA